jgi:hypothetical protein
MGDREGKAKQMYGGLFVEMLQPKPATWGQTVGKTVGAVVGGLGTLLWRRQEPPSDQ